MALAVLLIDENQKWREHVRTVLEFMDYDVSVVEHISDARAKTDFVAVLVGRPESDEQARNLLHDLTSQIPEIPILLLDPVPGTPPPLDIVNQVSAVVELPLRHRLVQAVLQRHAVRLRPATVARRAHQLFRSLVGDSPAITDVLRKIDQVSGNDDNALIHGESGTGKEVAARKLHYFSPRRDKPFIVVQCAGVAAEELEVELFGLETTGENGVRRVQAGLVDQAEKGTLYLENFEQLNLRVQAKLVEVIKDRTFEHVGSHRPMACDIRVIATSSVELDPLIQSGSLRDDLRSLVNAVSIETPPLRERRNDIPKLVDELLIRLKSEQRTAIRLSRSAIDAMMAYAWPGNLHELATLIERLAMLMPNATIDAHDLPAAFSSTVKLARSVSAPSIPVEASPDPASLPRLPREGLDIKEHLSTLEYTLIKQALDEAGGVVAHAAERLRLRRTTLVEKLRKYGISRGSDEAAGF